MTATELAITTSSDAPLPTNGWWLRDLILLLRPGQWPKNLLPLGLVAISTSTWNWAVAGRLVWAAVVFAIASSMAYVGNDIADRHRDRLHATKRDRPIAAGRVRVVTASLVLALLGLALAAALSAQPLSVGWPVLGYLALNVCYSTWLKHIPLVDILAIAVGFELRLAGGFLAAHTPAPSWLMGSVLSGCLVLALGKRREELISGGAHSRPALRGYTLPLVDQMLMVCAVLMVVTFLLYVTADQAVQPYGTVAMLVSLLLALFGLFRYLQLVHSGKGGANPARMLVHDRALVVGMVLWVGAFGLILVFAHHAR